MIGAHRGTRGLSVESHNSGNAMGRPGNIETASICTLVLLHTGKFSAELESTETRLKS